jgi:glycosyltransferase involved in cell wall biosynthesis
MVTPAYYPIMGGTETAVRNISIRLKARGTQTDIMTFNISKKWHTANKGKQEIVDGLSVIKIPALNWFPMTHSERVTMDINLIPGRFQNYFKNYDIIHFHEDLSFPLFSYFSRKPKILHLHIMRLEHYKRYFLSRIILKNIADLYICLTNIMKTDLIDLGVPEHKIRCVPNGVDTDFFRPSGKKEDNMILFVGRISFEKGVHVLLKSLSYLKSKTHLVIIGPPESTRTKYFATIMNLIEEENRKGKHEITYLGALDQEEVKKWYQKASVFVLPTILPEAFGIVNLEALACETPVVAPNTGGVPEVVHNYENGILVPPNDAQAFANAIQYLQENEEIREQFGKAGREWIVQRFSYENVIDKLVRIYEELIE